MATPAAIAPPANLELLEGGHLLQVPFESLKRAAKERKSLVDEAQQATQAVVQHLAAGVMNNPAARDQLDSLLSTLQRIQQRLEEVSKQERDEARRCAARLQHMQQLTQPKDSLIAWNAQRLNRLLVDYLQRSGHHETAELLAHSTGIEDLVDLHVFEDAKKVVAALQQHDCGPCLAWCATNRSRLRKGKSTLEFQLRVQEFIQLVKQGAAHSQQAIAYARTHLAPWAAQCLQELQRAIAVLLFAHRPGGAVPARYQELLQESRWDTLAQLFLQELYRLHGLPLAAPLIAHLQAGLSALKTPASYQVGSSCQDPLSHPDFQALAAQLPWAKHVRSQLLCSITHKLMDDANPPVVLPNGYVYSQQGVEEIKAQNNGRMVCPHTGASYAADELRRAFVV